LKSFDVVLIAGGGNLNIYWPELIARRAAVAAAANAAGVPYILSGQGVGPVSAEIIPTLAFLVRGARAVATRDPLSLRLLERTVPNGPPMNMVGDDALGLACERPAWGIAG
jgi:polysaccharide pyruvyl transferase WcaK-like protein